MAAKTIAIMSPGDMGHKVGEYARSLGHKTVTALDGRSEVTRMRAMRAGFLTVLGYPFRPESMQTLREINISSESGARKIGGGALVGAGT